MVGNAKGKRGGGAKTRGRNLGTRTESEDTLVGDI